MRTAAALGLLLIASWGRAQEGLPPQARQALEERILLRTFEEQGGRSHASGDRPELGPTHLRTVTAEPVRTIRVGLTPTSFGPDGSVRLEYDTAAAHNHERIEVTATGAFELVELASGATVASAETGQVLGFVRSGGAIAVSGPAGGLGSFGGPLRLRPSAEGSILVVQSIRRINRLAPPVRDAFPMTPAPYRGELEVLQSGADPAKLRLVNVVELEDYVPGVVINESLSTFHVEALRAQAIAARGYAVANVGRFADRGFDIDDSTLSQVYRGQSSETEAALEASHSTMGLVATRNGRILPALYSSSMGGHTESNEFVFPDGASYPGTNADPALRAIHDGEGPVPVDLTTEEGVRAFYTTVYSTSYEVDTATGGPLTSLHRWTRERSAEELLARLKESFGVPSWARALSDMRTTLRGASGRAMQVVLTGDWGSTTVTGWSALRRLATAPGVTPGGTSSASAPNNPSGFVLTRDVAGRVSRVLFYGGGFGHNVGMSQYGAHGRARRGQTALEILTGYYTGADVGTVPLSLTALSPPAVLRFLGLRDRAVLAVENHGLEDLTAEFNGRALALRLRRDETLERDVSELLTSRLNTVRLVPRGGAGHAVVALRLEGRERRLTRGEP